MEGLLRAGLGAVGAVLQEMRVASRLTGDFEAQVKKFSREEVFRILKVKEPEVVDEGAGAI